MIKPLVLITNDDGHFAPGIAALIEAARSYWRVVVVAPDQNRSAVGRGLSLQTPLRVREISDWYYTTNGTPVDCVCYALGMLLDEKPALLLSGVNDGANLGEDVLTSGTVGAAIEGHMRDIPSIAVSQHGKGDFTAAAELAVRLGIQIIERGGTSLLLNMNVPGSGFDHIRWTKLGHRIYDYSVTACTDPRDKDYYWVGGHEIALGEGYGTDCQAMLDGQASISPLKLDLTDYKVLDSLGHYWPLLDKE